MEATLEAGSGAVKLHHRSQKSVWRCGVAAVVSSSVPESHRIAVWRRGVGCPYLIASGVSRGSLQLWQLGSEQYRDPAAGGRSPDGAFVIVARCRLLLNHRESHKLQIGGVFPWIIKPPCPLTSFIPHVQKIIVGRGGHVPPGLMRRPVQG